MIRVQKGSDLYLLSQRDSSGILPSQLPVKVFPQSIKAECCFNCLPVAVGRWVHSARYDGRYKCTHWIPSAPNLVVTCSDLVGGQNDPCIPAGSIFTVLNGLPVSSFHFSSFPCNSSDASVLCIPECCEMLWRKHRINLVASQLIIILIQMSCWYLYLFHWFGISTSFILEVSSSSVLDELAWYLSVST